MEAVAAHAFVVQRLGRANICASSGWRAVERGVEAGHLRADLGRRSMQQPDRRQVVRLVQRRQRDELLQVGQHRRIRRTGRRIRQAAMHHAMADAGQPV